MPPLVALGWPTRLDGAYQSGRQGVQPWPSRLAKAGKDKLTSATYAVSLNMGHSQFETSPAAF